MALGRMKFGKDPVLVGDAFTRVGGARTVFTVTSIVDTPPGTPAHVRLIGDARSGPAALMMSVSALTDPRFFERVSRAAPH
jgi:hypothetical protein